MAKVDPKVTALLLGMPKGESGGDEAGEDEEVDVAESAKLDAGSALIKAVKSGSAEAVVSAFQSLYENCKPEE